MSPKFYYQLRGTLVGNPLSIFGRAFEEIRIEKRLEELPMTEFMAMPQWLLEVPKALVFVQLGLVCLGCVSVDYVLATPEGESAL